jgi:CelD/BcsL family acetyltransferase involved in cellulose biosynthesis
MIEGKILNEVVATDWVEKPYKLNFYFGEFFVCAFRFRALVLDVYFARLSPDFAGAQPPVDKLTGATEVLCLPSVPVEKTLPRISFGPASIRYVQAQYPRYYVETRGTFADYLQKFSGKTRRELTRQIGKFEKDSGGTIVWREFRHPGEMAEFQRLAREVSKKTYQERLLNLGIPDTAEYRTELEEMARADRMRGYILFFGDTPIVFHLCFVQDDNLLGQKIGYDPAFRKYSPGTLEQYLLIEKLFAEKRFERFDFGGGASSYKEFFATGKALCADVFYYRRTVGNLLILTLHSALAGFSDAAVKLLDRLKLKKRLKSFFRFRGSNGQ